MPMEKGIKGPVSHRLLGLHFSGHWGYPRTPFDPERYPRGMLSQGIIDVVVGKG